MSNQRDGERRRARPRQSGAGRASERRAAERQRHVDRRQQRDARRAARRSELLESAIEAIRTEGAEVSMEAMAAAGGVTKPILYRHFGDRSGLVGAIALTFAGGLQQEMIRSLREADENRELLAHTVDAYLRFVEQDPEVYRFLTTVVAGTALGSEAIGGFVNQLADQISLVVTERLRAAERDPAPALVFSHAIVGAVHQVGDWWLADGSMSRDAVRDHIVTMIWSGLGSLEATGDEGNPSGR